MNSKQQQISKSLDVAARIDEKEQVQKRVQFLKDYLLATGAKGYVLSISGGQDSTLAGKLAQMAVSELNEAGEEYRYFAVRLPYGVQLDEDDAQDAITFIAPTDVVTVNIKPAVDATIASVQQGLGETISDFNKGNTKARERMKVQYDIAAHHRCLVIGTDHAAEAVTGFFLQSSVTVLAISRP